MKGHIPPFHTAKGVLCNTLVRSPTKEQAHTDTHTHTHSKSAVSQSQSKPLHMYKRAPSQKQPSYTYRRRPQAACIRHGDSLLKKHGRRSGRCLLEVDSPARGCCRCILASLHRDEPVQQPEGMRGEPAIVCVMDEREELRAVGGKTSRSAVVSSGFRRSAHVQTWSMRLPWIWSGCDHDITRYPLAIRGQCDQIGTFGFALGDVNELFGVSVPTGSSAQLYPNISQAIMSSHAGALRTGEHMIAVATKLLMAAPASRERGINTALGRPWCFCTACLSGPSVSS